MCDPFGPVYEHKRFVHFHDCDRFLRLSVPGVLRFFEEAALQQSEALGVGFAHYLEHRVGWLLSRWDVRFRSVPSFGQAVTVRTQPRRFRGFSANRHFEILAPDLSLHVEGFSQWIYVDTERMRPCRVPPLMAERYRMTKAEGPLPWEGDVTEPDREDHHAVFRVRRGDIDLNGHVNNIGYVEWALESLPEEVADRHRLERLVVHYRGQTRLGAELRAAVQVDPADGGLRALHRISEGDRVACLLETRWRPAS